MSNRYDPDHPARGWRTRDYGRRDDRYGPSAGRRDEDESYADDRAGWDEERRWGDRPFSYYRSDDRYPERGAELRGDYRNPEHRYSEHRYSEQRPEHRSDYRGSEYRGDYRGSDYRSHDFRNAEQRDPYRPEEHRALGSSHSRGYWGDRVRGAGGFRGGYPEPAWSREPHTGGVYGYEQRAPWPASGAGSEAYHRPVRWRSELELGRRDAGQRAGSEQWRGNAGKGPKGYVRSDERIREDVCDRLSDDDEIDASEITVTVSGGEVRLEGTVVDRYSKHRAEDLAESVSGVRDITNNLRTRKGFLQEIGDKLSGDDKAEHRGHSGAGPQNAPSAGASSPSASRGGFAANR